jgi:hypothetical protein
MYAIAGSDAERLSMDEKFVGWGGEVSQVSVFGALSMPNNLILLIKNRTMTFLHVSETISTLSECAKRV